MRTRFLGILSLLTLLFTVVWLVLLVASAVGQGPASTFEQVLAGVARLDATFYLTHINATFITIFATALFAGLYVYCRPYLPDWAGVIGIVFVPVYATMNLFAYLSQVTLVPTLLKLQQMADYQAAAGLMLRLTIQQWPGSTVWVFNNLAYALLGIPSIIFGIALCRRGMALWMAGILLASNGIACIMGVIGILVGNSAMALGSAVGRGLFLLALIPMSWAFWRGRS